jgi:hypothetical protein
MQKKILAVLAAVALGVMFCSVALAQSNDRDDPQQVCSIIINIIDNDQYASQRGAAFFQYNSEFIQFISQRLNISPRVVQNCIQNIERNDDRDNDDDNDDNNGGGGGQAGAAGGGPGGIADIAGEDFQLHRGDAVLSDTIPEGVLPFTGGPPLFGFVLLLVAAGVAARLFR